SLSDAQVKKLQLEESLIILQSKYEELKGKIRRILDDVGQLIEKAETEDRQIEAPAVEENYSQYNDALPAEPLSPAPFEPSPADTTENKANNVSYFDEGKYSAGEEKETAGDENPDAENQQDPGLKRQRKKIDIANPDIIENFFRTDEDKNY
ncbi:MAG: hypothetical protein KKE35_03595, partial [Actinobacteria bacterium]|nr:hypothetical protein [Actinomycetota bacterium]